ncbi:putative toxin-antitoxin system toxin component, PIN family [Candidatus Pacearchaeota archaeon]|nr:putative toxin-antitoxin system toxin component, PIN family [Candidatus Pacearchaeota archaeon]
MKIVLDTNIWLSAIFWKGEANKLVENLINKKIYIIITENILSEIIEVLNREEKFQKFIENRKQKIEDLIRTILSFSTLIKTKSRFDLIKEHPKDNIILEAAFDGKANFIISYDNHILNMIEFKGIKILKPDEFLKLTF